jgi:hypothetical protein
MNFKLGDKVRINSTITEEEYIRKSNLIANMNYGVFTYSVLKEYRKTKSKKIFIVESIDKDGVSIWCSGRLFFYFQLEKVYSLTEKIKVIKRLKEIK